MKLMSIYLAGPIAGMSDELCKRWREHVKEIWPGVCLDPMRRDYRERQNEPGIETVIVEQDLADIESCDALLVNFDRVSAGTCMEIPYAFMAKKPIITVYSLAGAPSPWLRYHSTEIIYAKPGDFPAVAFRLALARLHYLLTASKG